MLRMSSYVPSGRARRLWPLLCIGARGLLASGFDLASGFSLGVWVDARLSLAPLRYSYCTQCCST